MTTKELEIEKKDLMRRILSLEGAISENNKTDLKILEHRVKMNTEAIQAINRRLDAFFTDDSEPNLISIVRTLNQLRKDLDDHAHQP